MEQNNQDNSGSIFINDRKTSEKHPDYKGTITIEGKKYWVSGWLKTRDKKDGTGKVSFISLSVDKPRDAEAQPVSGFPTMGGMLNAAASLASSQQTSPAPRQARPAAAPTPAPVVEDEAKDDLPF